MSLILMIFGLIVLGLLALAALDRELVLRYDLLALSALMLWAAYVSHSLGH